MKLFVATSLVLLASTMSAVAAVDDTIVVCVVEDANDELAIYNEHIAVGTSMGQFSTDNGVDVVDFLVGFECEDPGLSLCDMCPSTKDVYDAATDSFTTCHLEPDVDTTDEFCGPKIKYNENTGEFKGAECEYECPEVPKVLVPYCKMKEKADGNEYIFEFETIMKKERRQRKLRGASSVSRVLSGPWIEKEEEGACPDTDCSSILVTGYLLKEEVCDDEGCDCLFCDEANGCNGDNDPDDGEDGDEGDEGTDDPEEEKKETFYCIKGPDGIFHEGGTNVLDYMVRVTTDEIKQKDVKRGYTEDVCMKYANALCKKPYSLEPVTGTKLYHPTYSCTNPADQAPAP